MNDPLGKPWKADPRDYTDKEIYQIFICANEVEAGRLACLSAEMIRRWMKPVQEGFELFDGE